MDFSTVAGGLNLLREEIDGGDVPALGNAGDLSSFAAGIAGMQAAIIAGGSLPTDPDIDYSSLAGTFSLFPVEGGGGDDEITFMGEAITYPGDGIITYTPPE